MEKPIFNKRTTVIAALSVLIAIAVMAAISSILYEHTVNLLTENLRERIKAIAITGVAQFDPDDINALQVEEDYKKPQWTRVTKQLYKIRTQNTDILFAYFFRKTKADPTKMEFVADSHSLNPYANKDEDQTNDIDLDGNGIIDDGDELQWPGQEYPEPPEETFEAYNEPTTNKELYEDQWGKVITGYAPLKDSSGSTVAVLAVDIKADDFFIITRQTLYPFLAFIALLTGVILLLSGGIIRIWNKQVILLAELDRQKDELLSIVSHQLLTPITSVKWCIEMLLDGDLGELNIKQTNHLKEVQPIVTNLTDLVSMILDVSRIQLGKMTLEKHELDLNTFFSEMVHMSKISADKKNVNFVYSVQQDLPKANLDKRNTRMTIENLLSNAIKYTPEKGVVNLKVEIKEDKMLYCEVSDTGCGIPKDDQKKIFGKLYRASNVRNTVDGNGFGLYVAKGAIENQGGKIWFTSSENSGTTFYILLPLK